MLFLLGFICFIIMLFCKCFFHKGTVYNILKSGNNEDNRIRRNFRIFDIFSWITFASVWIYGYIFMVLSNEKQYNDLDFINSYTIIIVVTVYSIIFFKIFKKINKYDLNKAKTYFSPEEVKKKQPFLVPLMKTYIICSAILCGIEFTQFSNMYLDFSKGKEHTFKIVKSEHTQTNGQKGPIHSYTIYVTPPTFSGGILHVNKDLQSNAEKGDEVKIIIYNGLYGSRYTKGEYQLIKNNKSTKADNKSN